MAYEPKTIKVELNGHGGVLPWKKGEWAVFFQELLHGTQRAVTTVTRQYLDVQGERKLTLGGEEPALAVKGNVQLEVDLTKVDWDEVNDLILLGQIKEWSFGPVDQDTLDRIPEAIRGMLVDKSNELYGDAGPLAKGGVGN